MHHFPVVRSLRSVRFLSPVLLTIILGVLTSWATWTGYTANRPAAAPNAETSAPREGTNKKQNLHLDQKYGRIPLSFEANRGQADESARFLARGPGYNILLQADKAILAFPKVESDKNPADEDQDSNEEPSVDIRKRRSQMLRRLGGEKGDSNQTVVTMSLEGANQHAEMIEGRDELEGKVNYFLGADSSKWLTDIPTFAQVGYKNIYDGVDLVFYGNRQQLEYDLIVSPKVDPSVIQLKFDGVSAVKVDREGNLQLKTARGDLKQAKPGIYQEVNGERKTVNGSYVIKADNKIGFKVSRYDRGKPLIIDPILSYLSFVNGSGEGFAITADATGNAYLTGWVFDANLNPTAGVYQSGFGGDGDCFVTKLDPSGTSVLFTTYLGGAGFDYGNSIAIDAAKNVYIGGGTDLNFPTTVGVYQTIPSAITDGFIVKLSPSGSSLLFSTLFGGNGTEEVDTITIEAGTGNIFASGITTSTDLNTTPGAFSPTSKGGYEGYVAKFNPIASNVLYLTYVGASGFEYPESMTSDTSGNVYLTGQTTSLDFPTLNAAQGTLGGPTRGPFKSVNGGTTYSSSRTGLPVTFIYTSAINPTTPSIIYVGTDGGVFKTTDGGGTWNPTGQIPTSRVRQLTLVPGAPNIIYAGTEYGVYRSIDSGATWVPRMNGMGFADVRGIAIHQSAPNTIYAATFLGAFKSTDGGGNWAAINSGLVGVASTANTNGIVVDPTNASTLYIAIAGSQRVFKTINGGATWTAANTGLANSTIRSLAIDPQTPSILYAANAVGIYKTTNGGTNWAAANSGLSLTLSDSSIINNPAMAFVTVDPLTPANLYAGASLVIQNAGAASTATVFKSTDSGATWNAQTNGFGGINASVQSVAVDPSSSSTVFAFTAGDADSYVLKLNPTGTAAIFSTYFGGNRSDNGSGIAVDAGGNVYTSGTAASTNFPTTGGAFQTSLKGVSDVFISKLNANGALSYSTLVGGIENDGTNGGLTVDSTGSAIVTGFTFATDFPTTAGAFQRTIGNPASRNSDVIITKVNIDGTALDYSSYLGGDGNDQTAPFLGNHIAIDAADNVYVVGSTTSTNFPYFDWANFANTNGSHTFVAKISTTAPSYSVTGKVTNSLSAGVAGILVQAVNAQGQSVRSGVTDASGNYALISLPAGDYTVTPQKYSTISISHYIYAPASRSFPGLNSDQTANFVATQAFDIQGIITHGSIAGLNIFNVTVSLTGTASASTVTDVYGNFFFRDLVAGTYTVTPSKPGFSFTPPNRVFSNINGDQFASFTTTSGTYVTVSGRAADNSNVAISNAIVAMEVRPQIGSKAVAVLTDANGNYSIPNLQTGGNYNFQAFKPLINFSPQQQVYNNLITNQTLNFTGTAVTGLVGKVVFLRSTTQSEIAVMNADGSGETVLANSGQCSDEGAPAWSPNGSKIAFSTCTGNSNSPDLVIMNADGSNTVSLTAVPDRGETFPTWSPEGTRLSYTFGECSGSDAAVPDVFAIDANGGLKANLTNTPVAEGLSNWSPNGSSIVFSRGTFSDCSGTDSEADLYAMDAVGGNERQLTNGPGGDFYPVYSPDGSKIAFERSTENFVTNVFSDAIFVMDADGTNQTQISPTVISANKPTWSPDGTRIAFDGYLLGSSAGSQIYVVNIDGTGLAQITAPSQTTQRQAPDWLHYSISGQVSGNTTGVPIIMTLAGTLTRVTRTDAAGNYTFGNLTPGGNYSVTPVSNAFGFTPAKIDVTNLAGNQIANFALQPAAIPAPTPPLADDFAAGTRDPGKWNLGTQTQPLGAFDPQVTVVQQGGQLIVTPRSQASGAHYNGYVAVNSFDFNNAKATVEVVQPAANSAETIFAIGSDLDNYTRFVIRPTGGSNAPAKGRAPRQAGTPQLVFQVRAGGQLTSISINYDPVAHRFMRFRHDPPPANAILFETSPNNVDFVVRHSVVLQKSVSALTAELSAGTTAPTDPGNAVFDNFNLVTNTFQFQVTGYTANESANRAIVTVTRSGDLTTPASVDYSTFDDTARQRTRYVPAVGTLNFAAGQSTRTFSVLLEDNALVEGNQALSVRLLDSNGGGLNAPGRAIVTVDDNDTPPITTNPLDNAQFFVRQNYYDFLSRSPDPGGLDYWTGQITQCGSDQTCINAKRIDVSNAFYFELEFQQTGSYVYRLYRVAYGNNQPSSNPNPNASYPGEDKKLLSYISFVSDRARVIGGSGLAQSQLNLANAFIKRSEFIATYPLSLDGPGFVDAVLAKMKADIGADLTSQRAALISLFNSGGRGAVIYRLADDNVDTNPINNRAFIDAEYNRAFVATQYFGYLRRNPDIPGFVFWLNQVNSGALRDVNKQHAMVCSFVTSAEYQQRLSTVSTHSNTECPQ